MNLNHLRWALEVEKTGSFTAAANNLYIAQSNLSNAIKALEEELGFPIFSRSSKGVRPTPMGSDFLEYARAGVYHLEGLATVYGKRIVSIAQHRHCTFVTDAITRSMKNDPGAYQRFHVRECSEVDIMDSVFSGESMFGVMFYLSETEERYQRDLLARNLSQRVFMECELNVLVREGHPLLEKENPGIQDLYPYPPVAFIENQTRSSPFSSQAMEVGIDDVEKFPGAILVSDRASLYDVLAESDSVFFTGLISKRDMERYHLRLISFPNRIRKYSIITANGVTLPKACRKLVDEIIRSAKELL